VFVTAVFGVLDTQTGRFEYATAGHPAPLVYDGARIVALATSGLPIGLRDDEGVDFAVTLPPHCTLVLYTDGLLEFTHDLDEGERRIESAIRELDIADTDHLAGAIMKRVLHEDQPSDDIAILTASIRELPARPAFDTHEWSFRSSDRRTATLVRHHVGRLVEERLGRPESCYESELVFGELFSNVVRHAPGAVHVCLIGTSAGAELVVTDTGSGFPATIGSADQLAETGRGLHLVRALGDTVAIHPGPEGTRIVVGFHRSAAANSTGSNSALSKA
jgi:anti-sigma regulatory factor (Ser/Thr protein kinase)